MKTWRAREITIAVSLGLHGLIAAAALNAAHEKKQRRATTVSIADEKKPEPKKLPPPPPPPPPPKPAVAKVVPKPSTAPAPTAAPTVAPIAPASAPLQTNISLGNEVGMETGGARPAGESKPDLGAKPRPAAAPVKTPVHVDPPPPSAAGAACTEPPGKPEPTLKTEIEYTDEARAAGIEGRLLLEVTVDAEGLVVAVKVVTGVDPALDAAAIATVKTWRFKPALACGKPVAGGIYRIARRFELGN